MLLERKVELLRRYDFSEHRTYSKTFNYSPPGFGNAGKCIVGALSYLRDLNFRVEDNEKEEEINLIIHAYGYMGLRYDTIDFAEIEREIEIEEDREDFSTLFKIRKILPKLGAALAEFIFYYYRNGFIVDPNSQEFIKAWDLAGELADISPSYRAKLTELEEQLKSQPAPK